MILDEAHLYRLLNSMKSYNIDDSFEIHFEKQFLVPYSGIEDVEQQYPEFGGDSIYMIFQTDRLELTKILFDHDPPAFEYRNTATGHTDRLGNLWFFPHPIRKEALHMEIVSGLFLEVGIREAWLKAFPQLGKYTPVKISIYDLITQSQRDFETASEYQLLYIGASRNVYQRLKNHKTILKIYRDMALFQPNKELFVWLLKPKSKLYKYDGDDRKSLLLSSSVWYKDGALGMDVDPEGLLFIAEAILINYFKPEYNEQYVNKLPSSSHVVYSKLREQCVKNLQVNLNLFMPPQKMLLSLKTETVNTGAAKHISLYGALEDLEKSPTESIISCDVMPDELYSLFIGDS